ncbi:MAG: hypothetical protein JWM76_4704 [Pseudonocardiales bacterium]|nr:hypothetical protein [Pseudonocardiales bacterium]
MRIAVTAHMLSVGYRVPGIAGAHEAVDIYAEATIASPSTAEYQRIRRRRKKSEYDDITIGKADLPPILRMPRPSSKLSARRSDRPSTDASAGCHQVRCAQARGPETLDGDGLLARLAGRRGGRVDAGDLVRVTHGPLRFLLFVPAMPLAPARERGSLLHCSAPHRAAPSPVAAKLLLVRIGTWNLDGRWTREHLAVLVEADCDIWLLTEIADAVVISGYTTHGCAERMSRGQRYAGVLTRLPMKPSPHPHPASAAVQINGFTFCSSVLPWSAKDNPLVWGEGNQGVRTRRTVNTLAATLVPSRSVWGGDFNHALVGPARWAGSRHGRSAILEFIDTLESRFPQPISPIGCPAFSRSTTSALPKPGQSIRRSG